MQHTSASFDLFRSLRPRDWEALVLRRNPVDRAVPGFLPSDAEILSRDPKLARKFAKAIRQFPPSAVGLLDDPKGRYSALLDQLFPEIAKLPLARQFNHLDEELFLDLLAAARRDGGRYDSFRPTDGPILARSPWLRRFAHLTLEHSPTLLAEIRFDWSAADRKRLNQHLTIPERPVMDEHGNRLPPAEPRVATTPDLVDEPLTPDVLWALMAHSLGESQPCPPGFRPEHACLIEQNDVIAFIISKVGTTYPEIYEPLENGKNPHLNGVLAALCERSLAPTPIALQRYEPTKILWQRLFDERRERGPHPYFSPKDVKTFVDSPELLRFARGIVSGDLSLRYRLAADTSGEMERIKSMLLRPNGMPTAEQGADVLRLVRGTMTKVVNSGRNTDAQRDAIQELANVLAHFRPELREALLKAQVEVSVPISPEDQRDTGTKALINACDEVAPAIAELARSNPVMQGLVNANQNVRDVVNLCANYWAIALNPGNLAPLSVDSRTLLPVGASVAPESPGASNASARVSSVMRL